MVWRMSLVKCMLPLHLYLHVVSHRYNYTIVLHINQCADNLEMHYYFKQAMYH